MRNLLTAAAVSALLAACGTKGPLVMPPPATTASAPPAPAAKPPVDNSSKPPAEAAQ